jgi:uncharacterized protein (TIGR02271 family)
VGALWGLGILAGVLPAIGPAIAGGTLAAILSSAAAGAATAGIAGTLIGLGIPEDEANYYHQEFRAGRTHRTRHGPPGRSAIDLAASRRQRGSRWRLCRRNGALRGGLVEAEVRKEVRTEQRSVDVPVKKEELVIERHAVGRHPASGPIGENERVRIPLSEEQVDVEKRTVATEAVTVGKRVREDEEQVDATLRKENIKVDKRGRSDTRQTPR